MVISYSRYKLVLVVYMAILYFHVSCIERDLYESHGNLLSGLVTILNVGECSIKKYPYYNSVYTDYNFASRLVTIPNHNLVRM